MGGREGLKGEKREQVVTGRRGKPWVPWEQLWQVGKINHKKTINKDQRYLCSYNEQTKLYFARKFKN